MLLKNKGIIVEEAVDGYEAVEMVQRQPHEFDMIFMDYEMPRMVRMVIIYRSFSICLPF